MFDESVANSLQLISLPFEVLGFLLALIEIRFNRIAAYFRGNILAAIEVSGEGFWPTQRRLWQTRKFLVAWPAFLVALVVLMLILGYPIADALVTVIAVQFMQLLVGVGVRRVSRSLFRFVQYFSEGREIGTLGLMLASIGVMAECYQFGASIGADIVTRPNTVPGFLLLVGWTILTIGYLLLIVGLRGFVRKSSIGDQGS